MILPLILILTNKICLYNEPIAAWTRERFWTYNSKLRVIEIERGFYKKIYLGFPIHRLIPDGDFFFFKAIMSSAVFGILYRFTNRSVEDLWDSLPETLRLETLCNQNRRAAIISQLFLKSKKDDRKSVFACVYLIGTNHFPAYRTHDIIKKVAKKCVFYDLFYGKCVNIQNVV